MTLGEIIPDTSPWLKTSQLDYDRRPEQKSSTLGFTLALQEP